MSAFGKDTRGADADEVRQRTSNDQISDQAADLADSAQFDQRSSPAQYTTETSAPGVDDASVPDVTSYNTATQTEFSNGASSQPKGENRRRRNLAAAGNLPGMQSGAAADTPSPDPTPDKRRRRDAVDQSQFPIKRPPKPIKEILARQVKEGSTLGPGFSAGPQATGSASNPSMLDGAGHAKPETGLDFLEPLSPHPGSSGGTGELDDPLSDTAFDFLDDGDATRSTDFLTDTHAGTAESARRRSGSVGEKFDVTRVGSANTGNPAADLRRARAIAAAENRSSQSDWRKLALVAAVLLLSVGLVMGGFEFLANRADSELAANRNDTAADQTATAPTTGEVQVDAAPANAGTGDNSLRNRTQTATATIERLLNQGETEQAQEFLTNIDPAVFGYGQPEFEALQLVINQQLELPLDQRGGLTADDPKANPEAQTSPEAQISPEARISNDDATLATIPSATDGSAESVAEAPSGNVSLAEQDRALLEQARKIAEETDLLKQEAARIAAETELARQAAEAAELAREEAAARLAEEQAAAEAARRLAEEQAAAETRRLAAEQAAEAQRLADERAAAEAQAREQQRLEEERLAEQQIAIEAARIREQNSQAEKQRQEALAAQRERLRAKAAAEQERSREQARRDSVARENAIREEQQRARQQAQAEQENSRQAALAESAVASTSSAAAAGNRVTVTQVPATVNQNTTVPISDEDLASVYRKFQSLELALEDKNMEDVLRLTEKSSTKIGVFLQLFNNFESMDIRIEDISARNASSTITGRLRIKTMTRSNGERSIPSDIYRDTVISSSRQPDGSWSRISW